MKERKLRPHQKNLVKMLQKREQLLQLQFADNQTKMLSSVGILGDPHGYGRIESIITLIKEDKMNWDITKPYIKKISYNYMGFNRTQITQTLDYTRFNCSIILCGLSIISIVLVSMLIRGCICVCEFIKVVNLESYRLYKNINTVIAKDNYYNYYNYYTLLF